MRIFNTTIVVALFFKTMPFNQKIVESRIKLDSDNIYIDFPSNRFKYESKSYKKPKKHEVNQDIVFKKENLIGKWKADENFTIEFKKNGKFLIKYLLPTYSEKSFYSRIIDDVKTGDYLVDEKGIVTMVYVWKEKTVRVFKDSEIKKYTATYSYKVSTYSKDYFKFENITIPESARQFNRIK